MNNDIINIKGTRNGLVICLDSGHDFEDLKKTLKLKIESAKGFFKGAKFTFHLDYNTLTADKTKELEDICCEHGLVPDSDITWTSSSTPVSIRNTKTVSEQDGPEGVISKTETQGALYDNVMPLLRDPSPALPSSGVSEGEKKPCLMVYRSLRSGQRVNYSGHIVILGDVNPGSELTAGGDIIVMGNLRGVVHAGANGNHDSVIMAYRLNPVQLRIASTISRPPENNRVSPYPEIARLQDGQMLIEPYLTHGLK